MRFGGKVLTIGATSVLVVVVGMGALFAWNDRPQESRFCKASLAILEIDGLTVVPQDQGDPGRDGCDLGETEEPYRMLGFDCRIRKPDGTVTAKLVPNRADGTCGLPGPDDGPIPDPWPKA